MELAVAYYSLSLLGILKRKSNILSILIAIIMWIVFGLCTYNGDFGNYSWIYQNIQNPAYWTEFDFLYTVFMYICSRLGMSFIQFRMTFGAVYITLLYYTIGKYTENRAEVLGLYMLFPYSYFVSVVRSGFAAVLIVLAYYEITGGRNNKVKFWTLIIVASLFHYTSIFFAVYYFLRRKELKRISVILVIGLVTIVFIIYHSGLIYTVASWFTSSYRTLKWFMPRPSDQKIRWVLYLIIIDLMLIFLAHFSRKENHVAGSKERNINIYAEDVFYINITMLIFIPTFFLSNATGRFMWQILLLNIISWAKDDECRLTTCRFTINKKMILLIAFLLLFAFYANRPYMGTVNDAKLLFQNNLLYGEYSPQE